MAHENDAKPLLDRIDPEKRQFVGKLITTTAFVAPIVASFAMDSISTNVVMAQTSNR